MCRFRELGSLGSSGANVQPPPYAIDPAQSAAGTSGGGLFPPPKGEVPPCHALARDTTVIYCETERTNFSAWSGWQHSDKFSQPGLPCGGEVMAFNPKYGTMTATEPPASSRFRTLFLSDIHLGARGCQADMLLAFLDRYDADKIYLVGDIFDGWRLRRGWHWPQSHNNVIEALLKKAHLGVPIIYVPGNHDEVMRNYLGTHFGGIEVKDKDEHITADGLKFLVSHGDQYDVVVMNAKWLAHLGDRAYNFVLWLNTWINLVRRLWGGQFWSLSNWAKQQVKRAVNFIGDYEAVLADEAKRGGFDGIVCGHIHKAELKYIDGIRYVNCGDWVESCTAIVEEQNGTLRLIDWARITRRANRRQRLKERARTQPDRQAPPVHEAAE